MLPADRDSSALAYLSGQTGDSLPPAESEDAFLRSSRKYQGAYVGALEPISRAFRLGQRAFHVST